MTNKAMRLITLTACLFWQCVGAQPLPAGLWEGSLTLHAQQEKPARFKIKYSGSDELNITMYFDERPYRFEDPSWQDETLSFELDLGTSYACEAEFAEQGALQATCIAEDEDEQRQALVSIEIEYLGEQDQDADVVAKQTGDDT